MHITLNGKSQKLEQVETVADLIRSLGYQGQRIAVECNGAIVPKSQHDTARVQPDDKIEIVVAVGGG